MPQTEDFQAYSSTEFDDVSGLNNLTANSFVGVDAFVDLNGNIVARKIQAEEQEDKMQGRAPLEILSCVERGPREVFPGCGPFSYHAVQNQGARDQPCEPQF
jgi:hypothetical protein